MGAFEGIALVFAGAILKWVADMAADRNRKSEEIDKNLAADERNLRDKVAELDKVNSTAIATLTTGMEHIVAELSGIRSDMREQRDSIFARIDRNESEIQEIKKQVSESTVHLQVIETKISEMRCAPK